MKTCKNCGHYIRKIKGEWKHRNEHLKYSGIGGSGGVTFNEHCCNDKSYPENGKCKCEKPIDR
jgi:hypothetical protein